MFLIFTNNGNAQNIYKVRNIGKSTPGELSNYWNDLSETSFVGSEALLKLRLTFSTSFCGCFWAEFTEWLETFLGLRLHFFSPKQNQLIHFQHLHQTVFQHFSLTVLFSFYCPNVLFMWGFDWAFSLVLKWVPRSMTESSFQATSR